MRKPVGALIALVATLVLAGTATAAPPASVFNGKLPCTQNGTTKVIQCSGPGGSNSNAPANTVPS